MNMLCIHHNDLDGHCAGAIVKKYVEKTFPHYTKLRFMEIDYAYDDYEKKALDFVKQHPSTIMWIVDFHFSAEVMKEMIKYVAEIYVFDHHKSSAPKIVQYPKKVICHCDFESKLAGCELVWEYLFRQSAVPLAVILIGDRDKWAWKHGQNTAQFTEGLHLYSNYPCDDVWKDLLHDNAHVYTDTILEIMHQGKICLQYRDCKFKVFREAWGYEAMLDGHLCYVINIMYQDAISEMFGEKIDEYDICAATVYKNGLWKISFRSNKVDVSKIAQKFGGGGHAGAAGCENLKELPFKVNVKKVGE